MQRVMLESGEPVTLVSEAGNAFAWATHWLEARTGWVLVFDNVEDGAHLQPWISRLTTGQVLITTRRTLGQVTDILETGANDVYVVTTPLGTELLIPAIKDVVKNIDPSGGKMLVQPLPGMLRDE